MIIEEFSKIQVLNENEVKKWADKVHSLKDIWVPKKVTKDINIFILGTATYLDYNEDLSIKGKEYIKNRYKYYNKKYRQDLINIFQPLYDKVISALSINLNPLAVTSITAKSVTIFFTQPTSFMYCTIQYILT